MEVREHKLAVGAPVSALRFSNAERILFACGDRTLRTFSAVRGQIENEVAVQSLTRIAAFSQDGKLLATAGRSGIPIVDTQGGTQRLSLTTVSMARSLAFSSSGHLLAAGLINKTLCIWDLTKGSQLHTVPIGVAPASHLVFSPDERFLTVTSPDTDV